ncbi:MAG TPA: TlpA disulfide reductase family protein [Tepidiformaceae bacterium]
MTEVPIAPDERPQRRREYSGPASTLGLAALVIAVVALGIWFFQFRDTTPGASPQSGYGVTAEPDGPNPTGKAPAAEQGRLAPNFRLPAPDGANIALADYRGSYVLVNFWASWCGPCRNEAPDLEALSKAGSGHGIAVLGVNQQETADAASTFAAQFELSYPLALDRDGGVSDAYRVGHGLPVSFLLSPQGVIVKVYVGQIPHDEFARIVQEYGT